ncbi:Cadherin EGF LAG seven-pass G-type receptor 2 (Fragment) [Geodia barretti]|uniref:Cadherin EGF LAG seven-pass G-type receptor 2 n=1 Tax=Geodia barretti TaxID=519541 RepID=A0AA35WEI1_GEOBA
MAIRLTLVFILLVSIRCLAATCPNITATYLCRVCTEGPPFRYRLSCNYGSADGATMADITSLVRRESSAENFTGLLFHGFQDRALTPEVFAGFTSLDRLEIAFSEVEYMEADTFGSLPNFHNLVIHNNDKLKWLSGESFNGLNSLESLELERNAIEHLREDMEPFFRRISNSIRLREPLQCDCHLLWLVDFIATQSTISVTHDVDCISNSATDFSQCLDPCELGYHPCNVDAACTIVNRTQPVCTCKPCYTGDGTACSKTLCPSGNMECRPLTGRCECGEDFSASAGDDPCTRIVSGVFTNLTRDCSGVEPEDVERLSDCAEMLSQVATHHLTMPAEIPRVIDLLQDMVASLSQEEAHPPSFNISQNLVEAASELLKEGNLVLWQNATTDSTRDAVAIFSAMNDLGALLLTRTNITNITTDNIAMVLVRPNCQSEQSIPEFDGYDISSDLLGEAPAAGSESTLSLPSSLFSDVFANGSVADCSEVGVVSLVYGGIGPLLSLNEEELLTSIGCGPNTTRDTDEICPWYGEPPVICPTEWQLNSVVISATVINSSKAISTQLSSPVTISLSHQDPSLSSPICAFIDESLPLQSTDSWLTENCERDVGASTDTTTVCNCYHLTSFALVMSRSSSPPENRPLSIATKVGLSLSILCLCATVILLFGLKLKNKTLHQVHRQLALALGLSQLVFLVGVDRSAVPSPDQLCTAWAALLHYLLLATFLWQLCEGVHLYLLIGRVFGNFERVQYIYAVIAWGLPLLIVGPTLGLKFCDYGSTNYCWITPDGDAIWAFHGPVIGVLLVSIYIALGSVCLVSECVSDQCGGVGVCRDCHCEAEYEKRGKCLSLHYSDSCIGGAGPNPGSYVGPGVPGGRGRSLRHRGRVAVLCLYHAPGSRHLLCSLRHQQRGSIRLPAHHGL